MPGKLAILACSGALPVELAATHPDALQISFAGVPHDLGPGIQQHRLEKIGTLFEALKDHKIQQVVFAGSLARPPLEAAEFDPTMRELAPRLMAAMQGGDDALLRQVIEIFEDQGVAVVGAHELLPDLTLPEGFAIGALSEADTADATRACDILMALSPLDIGQGCVVAGGQCLGIETAQGTDALLAYATDTPAKIRRGAQGVFVKAAKRGQDLRIDMPAIGPRTIAAVAKAGLSGLVVEADRVMILDREATLSAVHKAGLFLIARVM